MTLFWSRLLGEHPQTLNPSALLRASPAFVAMRSVGLAVTVSLVA